MENSINVTFVQVIQLIAILCTGLVAGLMYGYDCSVINGLGNLEDSAYLQSFQSIDKAIQNPYFFITFMGNLLLLPFTCWISFKYGHASFYLFLAAAIVYVLGVFAVTVFGNIPLNEQIARFPISQSTTNEIKAMRKLFEQPWNTYHRVRTIAATLSFGLTILAVIKPNIK